MAASRPDDDPESQYFRGTRAYAANGIWWFDTREGIQFGPFICKTSATCALAVYLAQHVHESGSLIVATSGPPGAQDGVTHMVEEILDVLTQHRDFGIKAATNWAASRLEELRDDGRLTVDTVGRIRVLEFSLQHPEQTFDFEYFLKSRAG